MTPSLSHKISAPETAINHFARLRGMAPVLLIFLVSRLAFYLVALFGHERSATEAHPLGLIVHWRWDAALHYYDIAVGGYQSDESPAFFPLMPFLIRATATILNGLRPPSSLPIDRAEYTTLLAGILVAHGAALLAFWLLFRLVREETADEATAERAVLYAAIFPLAFFYAVPYTEALFLAASIGAFLAARRGSWVRAGLWAAAASATRLVGILLLPTLALEIFLVWRQGKLPSAAWPRAALGLLLAPMGLLLFMLHLWQRVGDPFAFIHAQSFFKHASMFPLQTLWHGIARSGGQLWGIFSSSPPTSDPLVVLNTAVVLGFLAVLAASVRRWRPAYVFYGVLVFAVILSTVPDGDIMRSTSRYAMVFFPVYITLARWGQRPLVHQAILILWLPLFGLFTVLYVWGLFVA